MSSKQAKQWYEVSADDANKLIDLFIHICKVGLDLGMSTHSLTGVLKAFALRLSIGDHDLQYYVDHPGGDPARGPITESDMDIIRREKLLRDMPKGKPDA